MDRLVKKLSLVILVLILVLIVVSGLVTTGCSGSTPSSTQGPEIGKLAPDFRLATLSGQTVSLIGFRDSPVLLNFWASWCGPCRYEMPFIQEIYEERSNEGLVVLAVNLQENPSQVEEFMESSGLFFPVLLATNQEVPLAYNIRGIPATFFIDKNGIIRDIKIGAFTSKAEIEAKLGTIMP